MKKTILLVAITTTLFITATVQAQKAGQKFSFGVGIEGGIITGDREMKEFFSSELGLSARLSLKAGPGHLTFTPGFLFIIPQTHSTSPFDQNDDITTGSHVPLKLGYKYIVAKKFFVMAEAGYARYSFYTRTAGSDTISKARDGGFTYAPSVGANLGKFEIAVRYEGAALKRSEVNPSMFGLRLGINF